MEQHKPNGERKVPVCGKCREHVGDTWWKGDAVFSVLCDPCHAGLYPVANVEAMLDDEE